jgi:hypothetical protein
MISPQTMVIEDPATKFVHDARGEPLSPTTTAPETLRGLHDAIQRACTENTLAYAKCESERSDRSVSYVASDRCNSPDWIASPEMPVAVPRFAPAGEPLTYFHSRVVPGMSLYELACALRQYTRCDEGALVVAVVLFMRHCERTSLRPTLHMMHRLYVACVQVGIKAHSDRFPCNKTFARIAGITLQEMNRLETTLVVALDWNVQVRRNHIAAAVQQLLCQHDINPSSRNSRGDRRHRRHHPATTYGSRRLGTINSPAPTCTSEHPATAASPLAPGSTQRSRARSCRAPSSDATHSGAPPSDGQEPPSPGFGSNMRQTSFLSEASPSSSSRSPHAAGQDPTR